MFAILLMFWAFFYYTEKNIFYSKKFFISVDIDKKYGNVNHFFETKFSKHKNQSINDMHIYTRERFNLEFQTWNYKDSVFDIIHLKEGYNSKFIYEEDEKFFKNTFLVNVKNQIIQRSALENQLIRSVLEETQGEYYPLIIHIGYQNKDQGKYILNEFNKIITNQIKNSKKKCNEKLDKIKYLDEVYLTFLENNFNYSNSEFVRYFENSKLNQYNCDIFYFIEGKESEVPRYNTTMFLMILFLFLSLIIIPLIYRINKK